MCAAQTLPDREAAWRAAHWRAGVASGLSTCCGKGRHVATTFSTAGPQPHTAPRASTPPAVGAHARARQPWRSRRSPAPARWPAQWRTLRPCFCVVCLPLPVRVSLPPSPRLSTRPPHPRSSDGEVYQPHRAQPVLQEPPEWHQEAAPRQGAAALHEGGEQQQSSATGPRTPPRRHPGASSAPAAVCAQPPRAARGAHAWLCGSTGERPRLSARTTSTRGLLPSCGLHTERAPDPTRLLPPHPPTPPPPPPIRWTLSSSGTCASQRSGTARAATPTRRAGSPPPAAAAALCLSAPGGRGGAEQQPCVGGAAPLEGGTVLPRRRVRRRVGVERSGGRAARRARSCVDPVGACTARFVRRA